MCVRALLFLSCTLHIELNLLVVQAVQLKSFSSHVQYQEPTYHCDMNVLSLSSPLLAAALTSRVCGFGVQIMYFELSFLPWGFVIWVINFDTSMPQLQYGEAMWPCDIIVFTPLFYSMHVFVFHYSAIRTSCFVQDFVLHFLFPEVQITGFICQSFLCPASHVVVGCCHLGNLWSSDVGSNLVVLNCRGRTSLHYMVSVIFWIGCFALHLKVVSHCDMQHTICTSLPFFCMRSTHVLLAYQNPRVIELGSK